MNKIYKVIWNKTRGMYMVVSELAKGQSKDGRRTVGRKKVAQTAAALAVFFSIISMGGTSYAAGITIGTATVKDSSGNTVTVFTGNSSAASAVEAAVELTVPYNSKQIGILQDAVQSVEDELAQHQNIIDNLGTDKLTFSADNTLQKESYDSATKTTKKTDVTGLKVTGPISAESGKITNSLEVGHNANVGGAVNAGSLNSRGNLNVDGNALVKGTLTSQSTINGNEIVSQTNITAKNKVVGMQGVVDNTLTSGNYVTAGNTVGENIVALDTQAKANADAIEEEARKRKYSVTNLENADKQLQTNIDNETAAREAKDNELNERITNEANAIHETTNQLQSDLSEEAKTRESKDNELNERITNEANAIHDEIKAGDTALDNRITAVKESLQQEAADTYVSKDDASVQDGAVVKANNKVGQNVQALDTALAKETAARIGADKAQDQVIAQVNQNMADGFNTINTNMANGFAALNAADAAEKEARIGADKKLAEAVNSGLSLSKDNVLQKNTTTVADDGMVTTSKTDANEMILNKGKDNQITLNENGIKVGTNSTVVDKDGVYTGGDTYSEAKAAMKSDGQIKGANGKFTVDASGNTTVTSLDAGTGTIQTKGDLYAKDATFSGDITAKDATLSGDLSAKDGTFSGDISAKDGTFSGDVSAKDVTATGTLQGAEVTDGTATMKNGNITGVKDLSAETITTSGDATIGGDLTVKGKLNVDEIDLTKNGIVGDNNVTASTKVAAGEITSYKKATSTKDGSEKESAIDYDENGTSTWAKSTDADGNWKKSTLTVEGSDVTSKVIDSEKNTNTATQSATESSSVLSDKDGNNTSSFRQRINQILQEIKSANGSTSVEQTDVNITNTAANGTITNDAKALVNKASDSITSQIGDGSAVKSVMDANGIANTATGGTISNSAANISNTTTGNMTNTVGGNLIDTIMGTSTTTVTGKVTEDYKSDLSTKVGGDETHAVTGNQTTTVSGNRTVNVKGTETENFNALETNVKTDQKTSVGGNQTTIVTGNQTNNVSGSKTETVKGSVKEKYGSQATTVDGDQSTNIGGNQTTVVAKDQTNTVSGNKTETVKGAVNETYGSQTTKVNGDQSTTVTGKQTNSITGDQVNTIGGNQTTTVTGDSSLSAKNITHTATEKLSNSAAEIENVATTSIVDKVGKTTVTTTDGKTKLTNEDGTHKTEMDYAEVMRDLGVRGSATIDQKLTVKGDSDLQGNATVGKNLEVKGNTKLDGTLEVAGKSTFKDDVTMDKDLEVKGTTTTDKLVVNNGATIKGGAAITGGTTTDTLHVTSTSTFDGLATFKDAVSMEKDLSVGGNATVTGDVTASSYKVGDKTYIDQSGLNANNQKVTNVANGEVAEGSTDAVNGGQLHATNQRVSTVENRMDGVENRVDRVENRVDNLDNRIDKVGASAAAMANLHPMDFDEDSKVSVAAAVGSYRSETAGALGVFYRPTDRVMMNVSTSFGNGENMVGGGVSFKLGKSSKRLQQAEATNAALSKQVANLQNRLDALLGVLNPNLSKAFPDVPANHWAYEAVSRLAGNDIIQGYEDGKYHGERTMTRYEMAEIIYNALSKGAKAEAKLVEEFRPELQAMAAQRKA